MELVQLKQRCNQLSAYDTKKEQAVECRKLLADAVKYIIEEADGKVPKTATLLELIDNKAVSAFIGDGELIESLHFVRKLGKNAEHDRDISKNSVRLAIHIMDDLMDFLSQKESDSSFVYIKQPYMSEAETRRLYIDSYLQEAGWDILDEKNITQPGKAGIEMRVEGMPNEHGEGFCDYVLFGKDGKPLAIIEAKKTSVDPAQGRHQVDLYADCYKAIYGYKPVMYYTNGYVTKMIDGIYPDRKVYAFHTIDELELMLQKRKRKDISDFKVNADIAGWPHQQIAVTKICERLNASRRRGLLVMATGTGKTRVAIALTELLTRNNWIKNVLFLADRTSLVNQAKRNFTKHLPAMSVCELSGTGEKDLNARLMFCTYQTMINYIDAEEKAFSTGRFDLIIIDEAHRSVFNKYGSIFKYFDSFLVGLTATPKGEVGHSTYALLECEQDEPNYDYSLEEAIQDKHLVGYKVINKGSKFLRKGIKYAELSEEEKEQLDDYFVDEEPTDDTVISNSEMYRKLFNKDMCNKVIEELMTKGLRVNSGETLGKTIIFAYNHRHAQMIVDCFHSLYPELSPNTCQLVDYSVKYSDDLVIKFDEDPEFRIAVSVDMLDTGVDITSILNLVFFKPVQSKIKFIQMIGRGTRLCPDVYGPGKNKDGFLIFDYCSNFEYFDMNPDGKTADKEQKSISQRIFEVNVAILHELQNIEYQEQQYFFEYYKKMKDKLYHDVAQIKSHSNRLQVREEMEYVDKYCNISNWSAISPVNVKEIEKHIVKLVDNDSTSKPAELSYDIRMKRICAYLLKMHNINGVSGEVKYVRLAAKKLLDTKASVPQVRAKAESLKKLRDENVWLEPKFEEIEFLREDTRELMNFLGEDGTDPLDVDIKDDIYDSDYSPASTMIDIRTYREKVIDYLADNSDNPVIMKIKNLEPITQSDLDELEKILWNELGTKEEYQESTEISNLAAFIRSLVGLSQEAINTKFGEYLQGNTFNSMQQEFIKSIISYVFQNGDVSLEDMVNTEPFSNYDLNELFGTELRAVFFVVNTLHNSIVAA